jgi:hypothetical protein
LDPIASSPPESSINVSGCVRCNPDFAPVVVTSPTPPIPIELSRPLVGGISNLSIRGARWSRN